MKRPAAAVVLLAVATLPVAAYDMPGMRDAMRSVFGSMRVLLELSATPRGLADPANERAVLSATRELEEQASIVSQHAPRDEVSFLASSLDRYALWLRRSYEWGRHETTARLLHDAVDVCIACHTRLPSRRDSPLAEDFMTGHQVESLPAAQRANLAIATRRFQDAMETLEDLLARRRAEPDFRNLVRRYLVVTLRVKGDPARARATLVSLLSDQTLPAARRERLRSWTGTLQRFEVSPLEAASLEQARRLVREGESRRDSRLEDPLVHYVAASRLLYEFLETHSETVDQGAEAYYLLGLAQYRIRENDWLPQAELFLEKAIRTAPASEHARRALALLRVKLDQSFTPQGGGMPPEVSQHLELLQELVESGG